MYVYTTDFSIALTTLQSTSMIVHIFTLEQKKSDTKNKIKNVLDSNLEAKVKVTSAYLFAYLL